MKYISSLLTWPLQYSHFMIAEAWIDYFDACELWKVHFTQGGPIIGCTIWLFAHISVCHIPPYSRGNPSVCIHRIYTNNVSNARPTRSMYDRWNISYLDPTRQRTKHILNWRGLEANAGSTWRVRTRCLSYICNTSLDSAIILIVQALFCGYSKNTEYSVPDYGRWTHQ